MDWASANGWFAAFGTLLTLLILPLLGWLNKRQRDGEDRYLRIADAGHKETIAAFERMITTVQDNARSQLQGLREAHTEEVADLRERTRTLADRHTRLETRVKEMEVDNRDLRERLLESSEERTELKGEKKLLDREVELLRDQIRGGRDS